MKNSLLLFVSLLSGFSIMAIEISAAKLFEPKLGTSITLWSAVIAFTMLGLALGYLFGVRVNSLTKSKLYIPLLLACLYTFITPAIFELVVGLMGESSHKMTILICCFVTLVPNFLFLGTVSPMLIGIINEKVQTSGASSGMIFSISTVGGIVSTLFFGLYYLPYVGISASFKMIAVCLLISALFAMLFQSKKSDPLTANKH